MSGYLLHNLHESSRIMSEITPEGVRWPRLPDCVGLLGAILISFRAIREFWPLDSLCCFCFLFSLTFSLFLIFSYVLSVSYSLLRSLCFWFSLMLFLGMLWPPVVLVYPMYSPPISFQDSCTLCRRCGYHGIQSPSAYRCTFHAMCIYPLLTDLHGDTRAVTPIVFLINTL